VKPAAAGGLEAARGALGVELVGLLDGGPTGREAVLSTDPNIRTALGLVKSELAGLEQQQGTGRFPH
jgi:hypothetical protein